jgi:hypothetical protein
VRSTFGSRSKNPPQTPNITAIKTSSNLAEKRQIGGGGGVDNLSNHTGSNHRGKEIPRHGESSTEDIGDAGATITNRQ